MPRAPSEDVVVIRSACAVVVSLSLGACASFPYPPSAPQPEAAFVEVPAPPPPARVEIVPLRPHGNVAWVDGAWSWEGSRWRWSDGGWFAVSGGARYATWMAKRRVDGTLLYANPQWFDLHGAPMAAPARVKEAPAIGGGADEKRT